MADDPQNGKRETAVSIQPEGPDRDDIRALLQASADYSASLYPSESNHIADEGRLAEDDAVLLIARDADGKALGCGALIGLGSAEVELKRMWIEPEARGLGLARLLVAALESEADRVGAKVIQLETGIHQPAAIALYKSSGYVERGPFGKYETDPLSIFMEKPVHAATVS